jgi:hypothetical protein
MNGLPVQLTECPRNLALEAGQPLGVGGKGLREKP